MSILNFGKIELEKEKKLNEKPKTKNISFNKKKIEIKEFNINDTKFKN